MATGFEQFEGRYGPRAQLAMDVLEGKPAEGIPTGFVHVMDYPFMEEMTGHAPGDYVKDPDGVYLEFAELVGVCQIDQYLATNPLSMTQHGYDSSTERGATTGAERIVRDGMEIDSPEAAVEHMEKFVFPQQAAAIRDFEKENADRVDKLISEEVALQERFGMDILKAPYGSFQSFPYFRYGTYGYANYFMAYALYPEVIEQDFAQQADLALLLNRQSAQAIVKGKLPKVLRLDHDMADSRGTLVDVRSLDRIWFPHFTRCNRPLVDAGVRLLWHCDGNLMAMVPRLIEAGISGFQGFQYEDGMDYEKICRMTDRGGRPLIILAGVSVTRTLPFGTRQDVVNEMKWLVKHGPRTGLFLATSSSVAPGTNHDNIKAMIEGLHYYRQHGREK